MQMAPEPVHPAEAHMRGILHLLKDEVQTPLLVNIRTLTLDAMRVLALRDPKIQKVMTYVLALMVSSEPAKRITDEGKEIEALNILDNDGFVWAYNRLHAEMHS